MTTLSLLDPSLRVLSKLQQIEEENVARCREKQPVRFKPPREDTAVVHAEIVQCRPQPEPKEEPQPGKKGRKYRLYSPAREAKRQAFYAAKRVA